MIGLEMENCNMMLREKQGKYQPYYQEKLIKDFEKRTEKQFGAMKSLKPSNKKDELK